jgi:hypothetical protein
MDERIFIRLGNDTNLKTACGSFMENTCLRYQKEKRGKVSCAMHCSISRKALLGVVSSVVPSEDRIVPIGLKKTKMSVNVFRRPLS